MKEASFMRDAFYFRLLADMDVIEQCVEEMQSIRLREPNMPHQMRDRMAQFVESFSDMQQVFKVYKRAKTRYSEV